MVALLWKRRGNILGIGVLGFLALGAWGDVPPALGTCDGITGDQAVARQESYTFWKNDTGVTLSSKYLPISVDLRILDRRDDPCRQAPCPEVQDTIIAWTKRLFTEYEVYACADTVLRLGPDNVPGQVDCGYRGFPGAGPNHYGSSHGILAYATKDVVLSMLAEACYVLKVDYYHFPVSSMKNAPLGSASKHSPPAFDLLGRKPGEQLKPVTPRFGYPFPKQR